MSDRNILGNGGFHHGTDNWDLDGTAAYLASAGNLQLGCVTLPAADDYIEQDFAVSVPRLYQLTLALKPGAALGAGDVVIAFYVDGAAVKTYEPSTDDTGWSEFTYAPGLAGGETYSLRITNVSAGSGVCLDDVILWPVPITRMAAATRVHDRLASLATEAEYSTACAGTLTEGDYTYAVDAALRTIGALAPNGTPDARYVDDDDVNAFLEAVFEAMVDKLRSYHALTTDVQLGPRAESLSQVNIALEQMAGDTTGGGRQVLVRTLKHERRDYGLGERE